MTNVELRRLLRKFPDNAVVCYHVSQGKEVDPLEGAVLKDARQVERTGPFPRYKLGPGPISVIILR